MGNREVIVAARVPAIMQEQLNRLAQTMDVPVSHIIREALRAYLGDHHVI
jgi:predicted DNA-binding protein